MTAARRGCLELRGGGRKPWARGSAAVGAVLAVAVALGACGESSAPSPFLVDAGTDAEPADDAGDAGGFDAGPPPDPTLGGPCTSDVHCDDGFDCTHDRCDETLLRCRFTPDDSLCQNGVFCDGLEICSNTLGCVAGAPVSCSDGNPCVINTCNEQTTLCDSKPRDVDGDGDPDDHCTGGTDCDDLDPLVSSLLPEVCTNGKDDDCDGDIDEADCATPENDTCLDPLEIAASGTYAMTTVAASADYAASCGVSDPASARDVVAAILLPPGPPVDVQLTARSPGAEVALALMGQCGAPGSEIACSGSFEAAGGGTLAKLRGRGLGSASAATALPAYVTTAQGVDLTLQVEILPAEPPPANETCGTAAPLEPGQPALARLVGVAQNLASACEPPTGELVYELTLAQPANLELFASSVDGDGIPVVSLRGEGCALPSDELTCQEAKVLHLFRSSLPAGTYYVAVAATAPTDVLLTAELSAPTPAPPDDTCLTAPPLAPNVTRDVSFALRQDDVASACLPGSVDVAYALQLDAPSDVLLVGRFSGNDVAAVELSLPGCDGQSDELACGTANGSPIRVSRRNVPAGGYRAIAESVLGQPMQLTAFVRPTVPPTIVPFADNCDDALTIPAVGGFFQGTTANAVADFSAGCDQAGAPLGGGRDQLLRLVLTEPRRVVLDMAGSAYATLLDVRQGPACPGEEVTFGCAVGFSAARSFLDLQLGAGTYYLQIDGFNGDAGPWFLDVRVVPP